MQATPEQVNEVCALLMDYIDQRITLHIMNGDKTGKTNPETGIVRLEDVIKTLRMAEQGEIRSIPLYNSNSNSRGTVFHYLNCIERITGPEEKRIYQNPSPSQSPSGFLYVGWIKKPLPPAELIQSKSN